MPSAPLLAVGNHHRAVCVNCIGQHQQRPRLQPISAVSADCRFRMVSVCVSPSDCALLRALPYTPDQEDSSISFHRVFLGVFRQPSLLSIDTWAVDNSPDGVHFGLTEVSSNCHAKALSAEYSRKDSAPNQPRCILTLAWQICIRLRSKCQHGPNPEPFSC